MAPGGYYGIFGATFACECGRVHNIRPDEIIYGDDAFERLPEVCARHAAGRGCAVLMDVRTRAAAGQRAAAALAAAGWDVRETIVPDGPDGQSPICDDVAKTALTPRVAGCGLIVSVGSGVINDLGKWLAFEAGVPFVTFATAASMNGYTSANVAPSVGGVKTLLRAAPPRAVLASPSVLAAAPHELTAAGLGDALAKSVSSADWRMDALLFGDYYCPRSVGLIADIEPLYLERPAALKARDPAALGALFDALLLTGAAMTMAESSAPASGGEHLISHSLDMMSALDGRPHDLHGRQVGVGTILAADLYRRVLAVESPRPRPAGAAVDRGFWGRLADEVAAQYAQKAQRLAALPGLLARGGTWDALRRELAPLLRPPEQLRSCLAAAGAAFCAEHILADRARLLGAFLHAHQMRPRITILDLAWAIGILPAAAEEIIQAWA